MGSLLSFTFGVLQELGVSSILRPFRLCEFGGSSSGLRVVDRDAGSVSDTFKERSTADELLEWLSKFAQPERALYNFSVLIFSL
jgi:hypothetical protein